MKAALKFIQRVDEIKGTNISHFLLIIPLVPNKDIFIKTQSGSGRIYLPV